jgi:PRC-barrel domain
MSIGRDVADAVLPRARTTDSDSHPGEQAEIPGVTLTGTQDAPSFAHIWQLFGYSILDDAGTRIGPVARVWTDTATGKLTFVGLTTGRIRRQTHVIPAGDIHIDDHDRSMKVPYRAAAIRGAPHHNSDVALDSDQERKVYTHYGSN